MDNLDKAIVCASEKNVVDFSKNITEVLNRKTLEAIKAKKVEVAKSFTQNG